MNGLPNRQDQSGRAALPSQETWWQQNRVALLALLPLLGLAALACSYRFATLYQPNTFSRPQRASGSSLKYHQRFRQVSFGVPQGTWYQRDVTLTLLGLKPLAPSLDAQDTAAPGTHLWQLELEFRARPDAPLEGCTILVVDGSGWLYDDQHGKLTPPQLRSSCVPVTEGVRPGTWTLRRTVALPQDREPVAVRVGWSPPDYAELPVR